jgi:outer membrane protein OmpA-like peptidoglycan-associated protein
VADIAFAAGVTSLSNADHNTIAAIVPRYRQKPGKVRVVGYAGTEGGASQQLATYRAALQRAQTVAAALAKAGIPADKIETEAAPAGTDTGSGRAAILLQE